LLEKPGGVVEMTRGFSVGSYIDLATLNIVGVQHRPAASFRLRTMDEDDFVIYAGFLWSFVCIWRCDIESAPGYWTAYVNGPLGTDTFPTGVPVTREQEYELDIQVAPGLARFFLNGSLMAVSTKVPQTSDLFGLHLRFGQMGSLAATPKLECDYAGLMAAR
ncbi:MAG: hypothetical protein HY347_06120, partial [candidate division NC10 bacterium]|nr:hypothetical protein [candidate division NC10 bacterium]